MGKYLFILFVFHQQLRSGCELECEALGKIAQELDMKSWRLSKYQKTFLALRFWRVEYLDEGYNHSHFSDIL